MSQCIIEFTRMNMDKSYFDYEFKCFLKEMGHIDTFVEDGKVVECSITLNFDRADIYTLKALIGTAADMDCNMCITYCKNK